MQIRFALTQLDDALGCLMAYLGNINVDKLIRLSIDDVNSMIEYLSATVVMGRLDKEINIVDYAKCDLIDHVISEYYQISGDDVTEGEIATIVAYCQDFILAVCRDLLSMNSTVSGYFDVERVTYSNTVTYENIMVVVNIIGSVGTSAIKYQHVSRLIRKIYGARLCS